MSQFLLEIGSEEIPARMQAAASAQLAKRFTEACAAAGLTHGTVTADATPRRLWLLAEDMAPASAATTEELKGPRADAPPQAIEGFLKKTGLTRDQLEARDTGKGIVLFAVQKRDGRSASAILSDIIPQIITSFDWPKSMRWGAASASTSSPRWVRPLTHIVALLDSAVVPASVFGLTTGRTSRGHRIHAPGPLEITSAASFAAQLREARVIVDSAERRQIIATRAASLASAAGLTVIPDAGLEAENAGLTEWPVPLLGHFDPAFLAVPAEVIQLTMRTNQKYFALGKSDGGLAPAFICVANLEATDGGEAITKGNERVLSARLSDAKFFWDQDLATVRAGGLEAFLPKLGTIVFHEKLGSIADKVDRVAKLARLLINSGAISSAPLLPMAGPGAGALADMAERAVRLSKADLVSATVGEFPEVQGLAGRYLALEAGESAEVANAIRDHYKPAGQADEIPNASLSIAVALADKIDTLACFFSINQYPTGSKDPFALRRAGLAVSAIILGNRVSLRLKTYIEFAVNSIGLQMLDKILNEIEREYGESIRPYEDEIDFNVDENSIVFRGMRFNLPEAYRAPLQFVENTRGFDEEVVISIFSFLIDRLKVQQREAGIRHDLIDAVFALGGEDDLVRLLARVRALQAFITTEDGANLLAGYKRAANILKAEDAHDGPHKATDLAAQALEDAAEKALHEALSHALPAASAAIEAEDFTAAMAALAALRGPVDRFFTDLMVNAPIPAVRKNRLALLACFRDAVNSVADFSRIEG